MAVWRAIETLCELRAIFDGLHELASNPAKPVTATDIAETVDERPLPRLPARVS
jgi:hypothetical protein